MQRRSLCPFCFSHRVISVATTERLKEHECEKCRKRWSEEAETRTAPAKD